MNKFAIVIPLKGTIAHSCERAWESLRQQHDVCHIGSRCPFPYLPLFAGGTESAEEMVLADLKEQFSWPLFDLRSDGLGIFLFGKPEIYVRWQQSEQLAYLQQQARAVLGPHCSEIAMSMRPENWLPKTRLAGNDTSVASLPALIGTLEQFDFTQSFDVTELVLLGFNDDAEWKIASL